MENDIHIFEAKITWRWKRIMRTDRVSCPAKSCVEFMSKINYDYAFADDYTVSSIIRTTYLAYEEKYVKGERVL